MAMRSECELGISKKCRRVAKVYSCRLQKNVCEPCYDEWIEKQNEKTPLKQKKYETSYYHPGR